MFQLLQHIPEVPMASKYPEFLLPVDHICDVCRKSGQIIFIRLVNWSSSAARVELAVGRVALRYSNMKENEDIVYHLCLLE
eukprot:266071-Chlamydomonas_euryale.AAC.2